MLQPPAAGIARLPAVPSGKKSRQIRAQAAPPPVRAKGSGGGVELSRNMLLIIGAVVALIVVGIILAVTHGSGGGNSDTGPVDFSKLAGMQTGPPPWNNNVANLQTNLPYLGLNPLSMEGAVIHIHQHLDVYVNGKHVTVPSQIGIFGNEFLTEIHTHDALGIVHVESPSQRSFQLGQFFGEWGVELSSTCLGYYCHDLHWWVDGKEQTGNPADLTLSQHQEIVIAIGKPPAKIPSTFNFSAHGV
jgi:hypothetical protein